MEIYNYNTYYVNKKEGVLIYFLLNVCYSRIKVENKGIKKLRKSNVIEIKKAIELAGGARELAVKLGVSYQSVLDWKNERSNINFLNCIKIEKLTEGKIKARDILPDYPWDDITSIEK